VLLPPVVAPPVVVVGPFELASASRQQPPTPTAAQTPAPPRTHGSQFVPPLSLGVDVGSLAVDGGVIAFVAMRSSAGASEASSTAGSVTSTSSMETVVPDLSTSSR